MKNSKKKNAFLASGLSMLLCIAMLVGTTFAWFTDTASTGVNKIQAGNLDIAIVDAGDNALTRLDWVVNDNRSQDQILWEPGAAYSLTPFKIVNNGNLALKYKIVITDGVTTRSGANTTSSAATSTSAATTPDLLDVIDFYVIPDGIQNSGRPDLSAATSLEEFCQGECSLEASEGSSMIYIVAKMRESAGNEYQDLALGGMTITVYATQKTFESDSFDNQYDANAGYHFENGQVFTSGTHVLSTGITATAAGADALRVSGAGTAVSINGGVYDGGEGGNNTCVWAKDGANVTIKDGTFTVGQDAEGAGNSVIYCTSGATVTIEGGFFYTDYAYNDLYYVLNQNNGNPGTIIVKGGTFVNYNPADGDDNLGESFVASGYEVILETKGADTWYTVVPAGTGSAG